MTDTPTLLEDMDEADQAEILLAWLHDRPLQWWSGKWTDRSLGLPDAPQKGRAYRLKPEPRRGEGYVNVYPDDVMAVYKSKAHSDKASSRGRIACGRIACVKVKWTEGQFDE